MLNLKKYFLFVFWGCLSAVSSLFAQHTDIPPTVLPFLEKAEYYRANSQIDSGIICLRSAQSAYLKLNLPKEATNLYAKLLIFDEYLEPPAVGDSVFVYQNAYQNEITKHSIVQEPDLYKKYYFANYHLTHKPEFRKGLMSLLDTVANPNDWDYYFCTLIHDAFIYKYVKLNQILHYKYIEKAINIIENKKININNDFLNKYYTKDVIYAYLDEAERILALEKDYEKAMKIYDKSWELAKKYPYVDSIGLSDIQNGIAQVYYHKKEFYKSIAHLQKAQFFIPKKDKNEYDYSMNLALVAFNMEKYEDVIKFAKKFIDSYKFNRKIHFVDESDAYICYSYTALAYLMLGKRDKAKPYLDTLEVFVKFQPAIFLRKPSYYYEAKGLYLNQLQSNNAAIRVYDEGVKTCLGKKSISPPNLLYYHKGKTYMELKEYRKALEMAELSLAFGSQSKQIKTIILKLTALQALGLAEFQEVFIYKQTADFGITVLNDLLKNLEREGSQHNILKLSYPIYEHAINAAYHLHQLTGKKAYLDTAFQYMEDSKSILLSQTLAEKQAQGFAGVDAKLIEMERTLTKDIQFYTQQARDAKTRKDEAAERLYQGYIFDFGMRLDSLKKRLNQEYPSYYALKYQIPPITIGAVQKQLKDSSLFIEYFEGESTYFAIGISQNAYKLVKIPISKTEKELIHTFNNAVQSHQIKKTPSELQEMGNRIYKLLLDRVLSDTKTFINADKIQRLVLIPDGKLSYLPFEALVANPRSSSEPLAFAKLPYLVYQYVHNYQYSARLWLQMSGKKPQSIARILGFAAYYPDQDSLQLSKLTLQAQRIRKNLTPLKGALQEVAYLRSKYAGSYYSEASATEKQLRASLQSAEKYQILHLAMHGLVNEETPEWSCLGFSPSADSLEDDLLQAHEIKALQMNQGEGVDMVVLSACETGLGKYQHGEGVISLGRGFVYGGANSLVMSLWSVNDDASAFLMERFYGHLAAGLEKDAALRQAKLDYLEAAQEQDLACHPALWAAFVQLGNIEPLSLQISQKSLPLRACAWAGLGLLLLVAGYWGWRKYKLQAES